jgi:hypothetical protein
VSLSLRCFDVRAAASGLSACLKAPAWAGEPASHDFGDSGTCLAQIEALGITGYDVALVRDERIAVLYTLVNTGG